MTQDPLVIFTPSGKRGRVPAGTTVLTAARRLGGGAAARAPALAGGGARAAHKHNHFPITS